MNPSTAKLLEMILVFGGVLAFGIWQYVSTGRDMKKTEQERLEREKRERELANPGDASDPRDAAS